MKLSIEELKSLREAYYGMQYEKVVTVLDELIAIREAQGVPVAYFAAAPDYGWDMFKNKEDAIATCQAEIDAYRDCREDGWDDDVQRVCWGVVMQKAEGFDQQGIHTSSSYHTYQTCDYTLQPELFTAPQLPVVPVGNEDCLSCDRHYVDGMKAGWNFHEEGDNQGFIDSIERVQKDIREARKEREKNDA